MRSSFLLTDMLLHPCSRWQTYLAIPDSLGRFRFIEAVQQTMEHLAEAEQGLSLMITSFQRCKIVLREEHDRLAVFLQDAERMVPQPPAGEQFTSASSGPSGIQHSPPHTTRRRRIPISVPLGQKHVVFGVPGPSITEKVVCDFFS